jgi:hypothetical protein
LLGKTLYQLPHLQVLPRLRVLCIQGLEGDPGSDFVSQQNSVGSETLAAAIGSLTQLVKLQLYHLPENLGLDHCCAHLSALVRLTCLELDSIAPLAQAPRSAPTECRTVKLLAGLTALQYLELENMRLPDREAMAMCSSGVSHLTCLETLYLRGSELSSRACSILALTARALPLLDCVHFMHEGEEPDELRASAALMQDMSWLCGQTIFHAE